MQKSETILCPRCHGEKTWRGLACGTFGCRDIHVPCNQCDGKGIITPEMAQWIEDGKRLKERRLSPPYRNQRTEATRLGLDVVRLSRLEQGLEPGAAALLEAEEG